MHLWLETEFIFNLQIFSSLAYICLEVPDPVRVWASEISREIWD